MKFPSELELKDLVDNVFKFKTPNSLKSFLEKEKNFWAKENDEVQSVRQISSPYLGCASQLQTTIDFLNSWITNANGWDEGTLTQSFSELKNNHFIRLKGSWIWSGNTFIDTWLTAYQSSKIRGDAFIDIILNNNSQINLSTKESLLGCLFAYEFVYQDESLIPKRRSAERKSFNVIKDQLVKEKSALVDDVTDFKSELSGWRDDTKSELSAWLVDQKGTYDGDVSDWNQSLKDLETKYQEKLRFDGPAKYWKDSADRLREQGNNYIITVVVISIVFIFCLGNFFHSWLQGHPSNLNLQSLEGVILFASVLSGFAILIRTFSRLAFSSFHLQRDAEEREQLTHLYLSLANETNVDEESRKIVLQALFSRSETGLLANDSSPTMPGVTDVMNLIGKK